MNPGRIRSVPRFGAQALLVALIGFAFVSLNCACSEPNAPYHPSQERKASENPKPASSIPRDPGESAEPFPNYADRPENKLKVRDFNVSWWPSAMQADIVNYRMVQKGFQNTYILDCAKRQFLWASNVKLSTGQETGNNSGAQWNPLGPQSVVSNAVYTVACRQASVASAAIQRSSVGSDCSSEIKKRDVELEQLKTEVLRLQADNERMTLARAAQQVPAPSSPIKASQGTKSDVIVDGSQATLERPLPNIQESNGSSAPVIYLSCTGYSSLAGYGGQFIYILAINLAQRSAILSHNREDSNLTVEHVDNDYIDMADLEQKSLCQKGVEKNEKECVRTYGDSSLSYCHSVWGDAAMDNCTRVSQYRLIRRGLILENGDSSSQCVVADQQI